MSRLNSVQAFCGTFTLVRYYNTCVGGGPWRKNESINMYYNTPYSVVYNTSKDVHTCTYRRIPRSKKPTLGYMYCMLSVQTLGLLAE
jgi:hypothetical protein